MHAHPPQLSTYIRAIVNHQSNHATYPDSFISIYPINVTYTDHNPQPTEHRRSTASYFAIHLFFPYSNTTQQSLLSPQTNKYYNCTYLPCVWNTGFFSFIIFFFFFERERERETDRQTDRQTDKTDRQTDRQTDREREQRERERERERERREREKEREREDMAVS